MFCANVYPHVDPQECKRMMVTGTVQDWFKHHGWHHFSTKGDSKASVVERWHRTLKERMFRYFTAYNTLKYWDVLPQLVLTYNTTRHRSIGMSPLEVTPANEALVWQRLYGKRLESSTSKTIKPKCKVGDKVRLNKKYRFFKNLPGWTEEVFLVTGVHRFPPPVTYKLSEWDGTPIEGTFYEQSVQSGKSVKTSRKASTGAVEGLA